MLFLVVIFAARWWHSDQVEALRAASYKAGADAKQAEWDAARDSAIEKQASQNEAATSEALQVKTEVEIQYRDRIQKVIEYVPQPGTSCPADADFLRRYNAAR